MSLILVADDDELVREIVRNTLAEQGHGVGIVANGEDAVRAFAAKHFDAVVLDCSMPKMSGIEVLRRIRLSPRGSRTPVLMLTARRSSADEEIAARAGANDYLRKPFSPTQVLVRVELLLATSERSKLFASPGL